ncbi:MAG: hypothetical protein LBS80_00535, partial [Tannerella sp.]|nr:hypothetical protein [Tannerella sp.]
KSKYYSLISASKAIRAEEIEALGIKDMRMLLIRKIPSILIIGDKITIRGEEPGIYIDDSKATGLIDIWSFPVEFIEDIYLIRNDYHIGTAIMISTKDNSKLYKRKRNENLSDYFTPLGYQEKVEFYSPRYDVDDNPASDLRTTLHWKPDVKVSESGEASLDFYTADIESTYSVVVEGVSDYGHIFRRVFKINRTQK